MRIGKLLNTQGHAYEGPLPAGARGGHRKTKSYGPLDYPTALCGIAKGRYVRNRVFFADEETARAAG